jgi:hypothetical protein
MTGMGCAVAEQIRKDAFMMRIEMLRENESDLGPGRQIPGQIPTRSSGGGAHTDDQFGYFVAVRLRALRRPSWFGACQRFGME